jgi:hypothetical protein
MDDATKKEIDCLKRRRDALEHQLESVSEPERIAIYGWISSIGQEISAYVLASSPRPASNQFVEISGIIADGRRQMGVRQYVIETAATFSATTDDAAQRCGAVACQGSKNVEYKYVVSTLLAQPFIQTITSFLQERHLDQQIRIREVNDALPYVVKKSDYIQADDSPSRDAVSSTHTMAQTEMAKYLALDDYDSPDAMHIVPKAYLATLLPKELQANVSHEAFLLVGSPNFHRKFADTPTGIPRIRIVEWKVAETVIGDCERTPMLLRVVGSCPRTGITLPKNARDVKDSPNNFAYTAFVWVVPAFAPLFISSLQWRELCIEEASKDMTHRHWIEHAPPNSYHLIVSPLQDLQGMGLTIGQIKKRTIRQNDD